jgi:hypothetical protein
MANDLPQKQPESHVEGSTGSTTDDTESNNAPTLEASAKESLKSARNKKLYLGGAVAVLLVVVIVVIVTVVVLGDGIRGDGKSDTRAATNSQSADGMVPSAPLWKTVRHASPILSITSSSRRILVP